jgi:predicted HTH transcriptional regulator
MFDSTKELLDKIHLGEDSLLELKVVRFAGDRVTAPRRDSLADELAALANSRGGVCVLGVDDSTRQVMGIPLELLDRAEDFVHEVCNDSIDPPLLPVIERLSLPTRAGTETPVIKIEVPRSLFVHRSPGGYFHRVGSSKRQMSPEYLSRLFQQRSQAGIIPFDEQVVSRATLEHLTPSLWARFRTARTPDAGGEDFLHKLGMARQDEDGAWRPTVAGVLLATEDPRQFLPNAFIQAVAYAGTSVVPAGGSTPYQLDAADLSGPLDRQVADACRFVARNMRVAAIKNVGRTDIPQYDITAVFEALVNSVAHRDYAIYGSKIRLRMYADRLELYSPGALANTMTIESLPLRQSERNETVTSLLARCPVPDLPWLKTDRTTMMDKRGEGVQIILERSTALSGRRPEYRLIDDAELLLTIYAAAARNNAGTGVTQP